MRRYRLTYRGVRDTYYAVDNQTGKRESLGTNAKAEAERLVNFKNEAAHQPKTQSLLLRLTGTVLPWAPGLSMP